MCPPRGTQRRKTQPLSSWDFQSRGEEGGQIVNTRVWLCGLEVCSKFMGGLPGPREQATQGMEPFKGSRRMRHVCILNQPKEPAGGGKEGSGMMLCIVQKQELSKSSCIWGPGGDAARKIVGQPQRGLEAIPRTADCPLMDERKHFKIFNSHVRSRAGLETQS